MAEPENSLFDIEVDADDYADAAAEDTPAVDRTHQSEGDFLAVKANYKARQDGSRGDLYSELLLAVPLLAAGPEEDVNVNGNAADGVDADDDGGVEGEKRGKVKLDKRSQLLLGYVVGELYYDGDFAEVFRLCDAVERSCEMDKRIVGPGVVRWRERARGRVVGVGGNGNGDGVRV